MPTSSINDVDEETYDLDDNQPLVGEAASDPLDVNEYDIVKATQNPRVKMHYPEDFEEVRNLPARG